MRTILPKLVLLLIPALATPAQTPHAPSPTAQKTAMAKLQFLVGRWAGPITVQRGPGAPLQLQQTEDVQWKLDGLVMLIEGTSRDSSGQIRFQALATISYDDKAAEYHFRAYNDGNYLDTVLAVPPAGFAQGFSWGYDAGPVHVTNTMHLAQDGHWVEQTEVSSGQMPPRDTMQMSLTKVP